MTRTEIKESQNIMKLQDGLFRLQALLQTISIAMYHLPGESNSAQKLVYMSFVVDDASKMCNELYELANEINAVIKSDNGYVERKYRNYV